MEKGKIIVVEGKDCSGKETQSKLLIDKLNKEGLRTGYIDFPHYTSPSGKIVGLSYLGKPYLAQELVDAHVPEVKRRLEKYQGIYDEEFINQAVMLLAEEIGASLSLKELKEASKPTPQFASLIACYIKDLVNNSLNILAEEMGVGWFPEGAPNVPPKYASGLYAGDRYYNKPIIESIIESGENLLIDRYIYSNMAHQGGKEGNRDKRMALYEWDRKLELEMYELPPADICIFLHMPTEYSAMLKRDRKEALDEHERSTKHLQDAETAYLEVASLFDFTTVECIGNRSNPISKSDIKTEDEISKEVFDIVTRKLTIR